MRAEGIQPIFSSVRHPQSNPVERIHRELGRFLRTLLGNKHSAWARVLLMIENLINVTYHETTKFSPIELHLGIKSEVVWEKWLSLPLLNDVNVERKIFLAREHMHTKLKERAKLKNAKNKNYKFNIGNLVLIIANNFSEAEENKIAKFFNVYEGPYKIQEIINRNTYLLTH